MEQLRQEQQAVLEVAARDGGSLGPCRHCSGRGYILDDAGKELVAGEELKTIAASACGCFKGREIGFARLVAIEREEVRRRGPGWIGAHRPVADTNTAAS